MCIKSPDKQKQPHLCFRCREFVFSPSKMPPLGSSWAPTWPSKSTQNRLKAKGFARHQTSSIQFRSKKIEVFVDDGLFGLFSVLLLKIKICLILKKREAPSETLTFS